MNKIKTFINYFELFKNSVKKEFRGKYKKSFFGVLWSFLNPLSQLIIYSIVFPFVLKNNIDNYICFIIVALIPWNFFTNSISQSVVSIVNNCNLVKKVYFPREILPISVVTSNLISFLISLVIVFIFIIFTGLGFSKAIILLPVIMITEYFFILGISLILSAINVYIRDLEHLISVCLMLLFYLCPIVYSLDMIPSNYKILFNLNPMFHIINVYRDILYYQRIPDLLNVLILFILCFCIFIIGYLIFAKLEKRFAEEL